MVRVYIGLGSNLDQPERQVQLALEALAELPETVVTAHSSLYRSEPLGPPGQPDYINAVAALETGLSPLDLLAALQGIEARQGRVREGERWGPRPLDLDILLYGEQVSDDPRLTLPHPGLYERNFVLYPLAEIAPGLSIPGKGPLEVLLAQCHQGRLEKLSVSHC
jgi:2-amino-4-hydroxy-6-hydroxymethyldihydropteridine diphosphokinase